MWTKGAYIMLAGGAQRIFVPCLNFCPTPLVRQVTLAMQVPLEARTERGLKNNKSLLNHRNHTGEYIKVKWVPCSEILKPIIIVETQ